MVILTINGKINMQNLTAYSGLSDNLLYSYLKEGFYMSKEGESSFKISSGKAFFYFQTSLGSGIYTKKSLDYQEKVYPIPYELQVNPNIYVYLDSNGELQMMLEAPNQDTFDKVICLGALTSVDSGVTLSRAIPFVVDSSPSAKVASALGILNIDDVFLEPIAGTLSFKSRSGHMSAVGRNYWVDKNSPHTVKFSAQNPVELTYVDSSGALIKKTTELDPTIYEDSDGSIQSLLGITASIQYIYRAASGDVAIMPGQSSYIRFDEAVSNINTSRHFKAPTLTGFTLIARVVASSKATDLDGTDVKIYHATKFGSDGQLVNN